MYVMSVCIHVCNVGIYVCDVVKKENYKVLRRMKSASWLKEAKVSKKVNVTSVTHAYVVACAITTAGFGQLLLSDSLHTGFG